MSPKRFKVTLSETFKFTDVIEAKTSEEAMMKAQSKWHEGEYSKLSLGTGNGNQIKIEAEPYHYDRMA